MAAGAPPPPPSPEPRTPMNIHAHTHAHAWTDHGGQYHMHRDRPTGACLLSFLEMLGKRLSQSEHIFTSMSSW